MCYCAVYIKSDDDSLRDAVNQHHLALLTLSRCKNVTLVDQCNDAQSTLLTKCLSIPTLNGSSMLYVDLHVRTFSSLLIIVCVIVLESAVGMQ
jgi:hypothetical protein